MKLSVSVVLDSQVSYGRPTCEKVLDKRQCDLTGPHKARFHPLSSIPDGINSLVRRNTYRCVIDINSGRGTESMVRASIVPASEALPGSTYVVGS